MSIYWCCFCFKHCWADILSLQGEIQSNDGDITTIQNISSLQGQLDTTQGSIKTDSTAPYTGVVPQTL